MSSFESMQPSSAEGVANGVSERAKHYVNSGVDALKAVSNKVCQVGHDADGYVRENPWVAISVAAGVGLLVGFLVRGRRGA